MKTIKEAQAALSSVLDRAYELAELLSDCATTELGEAQMAALSAELEQCSEEDRNGDFSFVLVAQDTDFEEENCDAYYELRELLA